MRTLLNGITKMLKMGKAKKRLAMRVVFAVYSKKSFTVHPRIYASAGRKVMSG